MLDIKINPFNKWINNIVIYGTHMISTIVGYLLKCFLSMNYARHIISFFIIIINALFLFDLLQTIFQLNCKVPYEWHQPNQTCVLLKWQNKADDKNERDWDRFTYTSKDLFFFPPMEILILIWSYYNVYK